MATLYFMGLTFPNRLPVRNDVLMVLILEKIADVATYIISCISTQCRNRGNDFTEQI